MVNVGITGHNGFIAKHLLNTISIREEYEIVPFEREFFDNEELLNKFVKRCDVIIHLAALNRHEDQDVIFKINTDLVKKIINALKVTNSIPHVIFSSSVQEENDSLYGKSKKYGRELFINWANNSNGKFSGLIIPNVFGPFGTPYYNSVIATFCHQLVNGELPKIIKDSELKTIYISELVDQILIEVNNNKSNFECIIAETNKIKVSKILDLLKTYKEKYFEKGEIPYFSDIYEINLFNTFRSYINIESFFPKQYQKHKDDRGTFVEIIRLHSGGQVSFSTTKSNVVRGNHFHTRKIERFSVIKGKALVQLRKIGDKKIYEFYLDGDTPSYVDMPIWYTHNIKNIGEDVLYTNFWISEIYNPDNSDTYFETV